MGGDHDFLQNGLWGRGEEERHGTFPWGGAGIYLPRMGIDANAACVAPVDHFCTLCFCWSDKVRSGVDMTRVALLARGVWLVEEHAAGEAGRLGSVPRGG